MMVMGGGGVSKSLLELGWARYYRCRFLSPAPKDLDAGLGP